MTWSEHTTRVLRDAGHRAGGARAAVIEALARQTCCATAQEIHDALRGSARTVGIASVYRVLDVLTDLRLLQRVDVGDGVARYEPVLPDGAHHHHVVCDDCGKVEPFHDPTLEQAIASASGRLGYAVDAHEVVLRGECADCRPG